MTLPQAPITNDTYSPDDELESLLAEVGDDTYVDYNAETEFPLPGRLTGKQLSYEVRYDGVELEGTETITPASVMVSLVGHLGCAASVQLVNAITYGEPTLLYLDVEPASDEREETYSDFTVEWHPEAAIEQGLLDSRLENRFVDFEPHQVELETVERWSQSWLRSE